jgi:hypothetical protein
MLVSIALIVFALVNSAFAAYPYTTTAIGSHLHRSFGALQQLPMNKTAAISAGWRQASPSCVPGIGLMYFYKSTKPNLRV